MGRITVTIEDDQMALIDAVRGIQDAEAAARRAELAMTDCQNEVNRAWRHLATVANQSFLTGLDKDPEKCRQLMADVLERIGENVVEAA